MEIKPPPSVPESEYSLQFLQGMVDRMGNSYATYGLLAEAFPHPVNALACLQDRLAKYVGSGNTEWLMDVANFAMIEFMRPRHPDAHYRPTGSHESPGRRWDGEIDPSVRPTNPKRWG
jgi:hypothetical protein